MAVEGVVVLEVVDKRDSLQLKAKLLRALTVRSVVVVVVETEVKLRSRSEYAKFE